MVDTNLTKEMIETGAALVRKLDESGFKPDAVFWFYFPDKQAWKLVIAEVKVGEQGPKEMYRQIQKILAKFPKEISGLSLDDVALAKPDAPIVALLRVALRTGPEIGGIRFKNNIINGILIEDAYIYRLTKPEKFRNFEIEKEELRKEGDYRTWMYRIRNTESGNEFRYRIEITGTALASKGLPTQIQDAVDTEGKSLVKEWLKEGKEYWILGKVGTVGIKEMRIKEGKYGKLL
jgi:hypothetical protein